MIKVKPTWFVWVDHVDMQPLVLDEYLEPRPGCVWLQQPRIQIEVWKETQSEVHRTGCVVGVQAVILAATL